LGVLNGHMPNKASMITRSALFWGITQRRVVILYRRFGTTYQSHVQGSRSPRRVQYDGDVLRVVFNLLFKCCSSKMCKMYCHGKTHLHGQRLVSWFWPSALIFMVFSLRFWNLKKFCLLGCATAQYGRDRYQWLEESAASYRVKQ
jgi:hypothetical protein